MIAVVVVILAIIAVIVFAVRFFTDKTPVSRVYDAYDLAMDGQHRNALAEYDKAIKDFTWAVRGHPDYMTGNAWGVSPNLGYRHMWLAYAWRALSLCALGMHDEALGMADTAMKRGQDDARVRYAGVVALGACGLHDEALNLANRCVEHDPRATEFYYARVLVLLDAGRMDEAERLATMVASVEPDDALARAGGAMVLWWAGDARGALDAIDESISNARDQQAKALQRIRIGIAKGRRPRYGECAMGGARRDP